MAVGFVTLDPATDDAISAPHASGLNTPSGLTAVALFAPNTWAATQDIASKWNDFATSEQRSFRWSTTTGGIRFQISTDGTIATNLIANLARPSQVVDGQPRWLKVEYDLSTVTLFQSGQNVEMDVDTLTWNQVDSAALAASGIHSGDGHLALGVRNIDGLNNKLAGRYYHFVMYDHLGNRVANPDFRVDTQEQGGPEPSFLDSHDNLWGLAGEAEWTEPTSDVSFQSLTVDMQRRRFLVEV